MRKLTDNERRLLWLLGGAIFVIANFYGVSYLLDREADLSSKLSELESTIKSHHVWLQEKDFWLAASGGWTRSSPTSEKTRCHSRSFWRR